MASVVAPLPEACPKLRDYLYKLIADPNTRVYAVMDGAFFKNIATMLRDAGLARRPLYRYDGDYAVVLGGPWLVDLYYQNDAGNLTIDAGEATDAQRIEEIASRLDALMGIVGDKPGLVFWVGDVSLTEAELYEHLRRLNQIEAPQKVAGHETRYERVTFRHADANVMTQVLPALDEGQLSRLLGTCQQIIFKPEAEWSQEALHLVRPENLPAPPDGPLRWTPQTISLIEEARFHWLVTRTMQYLRKSADHKVKNVSDEVLRADVYKWLKAAAAYGVNQEVAFRKWSYLQVVTGGRLETLHGLRDFMAASEPVPDPNEKVAMIMRETIKHLKEA